MEVYMLSANSMLDYTSTSEQFLRVFCEPLNSASANTPNTIPFYTYNGVEVDKFPHLRGADRNGDGQVDFIIGVSTRDLPLLREVMSRNGATLNQQTLWKDPVSVSWTELEEKCQLVKKDKEGEKGMFATAFGGFLVLSSVVSAFGGFPVGVVIVGVVAGIAILCVGLSNYHTTHTTTENNFIEGMKTLLQPPAP
jgi:hypothetical protein